MHKKHCRLLTGSTAAAVALGVLVEIVAGENRVVPSAECTTIPVAMLKAKAGDTVLVKKGTYVGPFFIGTGVCIVSETPGEAILEGNGQQDVVTMPGRAEIAGFEIRNGTVGILSKGAGNRIIDCRIIKNWQTGIVCIGHLPQIENNVIAYNKGSGIQGYKVRATVYPAIAYNTIAYNGNHGIAVGGISNIGIHNNIIAFNERFGVKISEDESAIKLESNCFFGNGSQIGNCSGSNFCLDPRFVAPRDLDFALAGDSPCKGKSSDGKDLGTHAGP
jgi:hypothetical protein